MMNDTIEYKGYVIAIEADSTTYSYYGSYLLNGNRFEFKRNTIQGIKENFKKIIDRHIADSKSGDKINPKTGLTELEQKCMDSLLDCHKYFFQLEEQHPDDPKDFVIAMHRIQDLLAIRIVRRLYPEGWKNTAKNKI